MMKSTIVGIKFLDTGAASGDYPSPAIEQLLNRN